METVLSTDKYVPMVEQVLSAGGDFFLIYIALRSPELAVERTRERVRRGGHDVPAEKVRARWRRSLEQLPRFARRATHFWVFDNSNSDPDIAPRLLAEGNAGICLELHDDIPEMSAALRPLVR